MINSSDIKPYVDENGLFHYDSINQGIWYAMHCKAGIGARAISAATSLIKKFNKGMQTTENSELDFMTSYAPTYRCLHKGGKITTKYVFSNIIFIHTTPSILKQFITFHPYQLYFIRDYTVAIETNKDEYGNLTNDLNMRVKNEDIKCLYMTLQAYNNDIQIYTASELQEMKYTRKVEIVDGPLAGQICRIKTIEGKKRVIIELFDGYIGMAIVMPSTHFKKV